MPLTFYPHPDDTQKGTLEDRIALMLESAERYKAAILDVSAKPETTEVGADPSATKRTTPRDQTVAYNWEEIAILLREVRELPEGNRGDKAKKADLLTRLANVYEVLRGAKMSKLEAVRLALMNEANQLNGGASQTVG